MFDDPARFGFSEQDSTEYVRMVAFYIDQLKSYLPGTRLKTQWTEALNNLVFETKVNQGNSGKWVTTYGSVYFLGEKISIPEQEDFFNEQDGKSCLEYYSREQFLKLLDRFPAYNALKDL